MQINRTTVQSATITYLLFGILYLGTSLFCAATMVASTLSALKVIPQFGTITDKGDITLMSILLPFLILMTFMGLWFIKMYRNRGAFEIFSIKKEGAVDFDALHNGFIEVGDTPEKIYLIRREDEPRYDSYKIIHKID